MSLLLDPVHGLRSKNDRDELERLQNQNGVFSWSIFTRNFSCDSAGKLFVIFSLWHGHIVKFLFPFEGDKFSMWTDCITRYGISKQDKTQALVLHVLRNIWSLPVVWKSPLLNFNHSSWRSQTTNHSSSSSSYWNKFVSNVLFQLFAWRLFLVRFKSYERLNILI